MIELLVLTGPDAGTSFRPVSGPFRVGRAAGMPLRVSGPGVWDHHFDIERGSDGRLQLRTAPGARVSIDDEFVEEKALRNGMVISCGGVRLRFTLSSPSQRPLLCREASVWVGFALLLVFELMVLGWVGH